LGPCHYPGETIPVLPISRSNSLGFRLILGIALLTVTWLMITPRPPSPEAFNDKIAHGLTFFFLAFLADAGWPDLSYNWKKYAPLAVYAVVTEIMQHFVPERTADMADILADWSGLALYTFVPVTLHRLLRPEQ